MEDNSKEKFYTGNVNDRQVKGKTYKEFIINYLTELASQYKELDVLDRLDAYIGYFIKNFSYDKDLRDKILTTEFVETRENREKSLFELLHDKKGVCDQLAQAFSLLGCIDETWKNGVIIEYSACKLLVKGKEISHATNHLVVGNQKFALDLSTMIHCKQKDDGHYANLEDFRLVSLEEYEKNLSYLGIEILPLEKDNICFANLYLHINPDEYFTRLTTPTDEINSKHTDWIQPGISIEKSNIINN